MIFSLRLRDIIDNCFPDKNIKYTGNVVWKLLMRAYLYFYRHFVLQTGSSRPTFNLSCGRGESGPRQGKQPLPEVHKQLDVYRVVSKIYQNAHISAYKYRIYPKPMIN